MNKWKDRILITLAYTISFTGLFCGCLLDAGGLVGDMAFKGLTVCEVWMGLFCYANNWFKGRRYRWDM